MAEFAYQFWKRVDEVRGDIPLSKVAEAIGIKDQSIRAMRSQNRFPKSNVIHDLAGFLGTTVEFLMSGDEVNSAPSMCKEALFVQNNPEARLLIRAVMEDPSILPLVSALAEKAVPSINKENGA